MIRFGGLTTVSAYPNKPTVGRSAGMSPEDCGGNTAALAYRRHMSETTFDLPITNGSVHAVHEKLFAPWVRELGLRDLDVSEGRASATLPQSDHVQWLGGTICGQAIMAAIDSVASLAMMTTDRPARGTTSLNTHFLRPAEGDDLRIETRVVRFGSSIAVAETRVSFASTGDLVALSTCEFSF